MTAKIQRFIEERRPQTPFLVVDLDVIRDNYLEFRRTMPEAEVFYAIKANPAPEILSLLVELGSSFDCASLPEIDMALEAGAAPERISFGNTIKKASDIAGAYARGVRLYAFDSESELEKIAQFAPGSRVFCRILTSNEGAEWPLSRKFGCEKEMALDLLTRAKDMGITPWGVSFHVGSQQTDPTQWEIALADAAWLFAELEKRDITLGLVNLGGGFPTYYRKKLMSTEQYGATIRRAVLTAFGNRLPQQIIIEPGRGLVGNAGKLMAEVVLVSKKSANDNKRWVYLDIGRFGGLAEAMDDGIHYKITSDRTGVLEPVIIAGPTCDSVDVMYEKSDYKLPADLKAGDMLTIHATGAYTTTYSAVAFNGFAPLKAYYV
jgi:ornithine decarboxylase